MGVNTQKYIRKPLYVDAVRVTDKNFDEVVAWCQGEVETEEVGRKGTLKKFIRVRVHNPKNPRQTKAFIGDWVLYTERGYKVYKDIPFREAFDLVADVGGDELKFFIDPATGGLTETPPHEGIAPLSLVELGEILRKLAKIDEETEAPAVETTVPKQFGGEQTADALREKFPLQAGDLGTTPQGEPIEVVEATPQAIADVVNEQQPVEALTTEEATRLEQKHASMQGEPVAEGVVVESSPTSPPVEPPQPGDEKDHWDSPNPPQPEPVSEQPPPDAAAGKYVLSEKEQADLGPEGVRELLASGEAVLAQDLA